MAKNILRNPTTLLIATLVFTLIFTGKSQRFSRNLSQTSLGLKKEKLSHLHFYFHNIVSGKNPTAIHVVKPPATEKTSATKFGLVTIIDDALTVGPEKSSKLLGRAQGLYASADLNKIGFLMVLNYAFVEGKYNGSTLSILGKNADLMPMREMPIIGGSGLFRFARGYAQVKTHSFDIKTKNAIFEYNVYVIHY